VNYQDTKTIQHWILMDRFHTHSVHSSRSVSTQHRSDLTNCSGRKGYLKHRSFIFSVAFGRDHPAVHLYQMTHDRQSQSQSSVRAGHRCVRLTESFKNVRQKLLPYPHTTIADRDFDIRIDVLQANIDTSPFRRKFDCVREQVPNDLLEAIRVAKYYLPLRLEMHFQNDLFAIDGRPHSVNGRVNNQVQLHRL